MCDILNDLSTLTTIPLVSLERLSDLTISCICHSVEESLIENENITSIDLGIGKLHIKLEDNNIYYKFIPSSNLENNIKQTVISGNSPLTLQVEATLKDRITKTYKDFI